jgi:hypothetical protein
MEPFNALLRAVGLESFNGAIEFGFQIGPCPGAGAITPQQVGWSGGLQDALFAIDSDLKASIEFWNRHDTISPEL